MLVRAEKLERQSLLAFSKHHLTSKFFEVSSATCTDKVSAPLCKESHKLVHVFVEFL